MKQIILIPLFSLAALFLFMNNSLAQTDGYSDELTYAERFEISLIYLESIKEGGIVVRLRTGSSKIKLLEKQIANSSDPDRQDRFRKMMKLEQKTRTLENKELMLAFKQGFSYCPVYFIPDTLIAKLDSLGCESCFLGEDGNIDDSIQLKSGWQIAHYGFSSSSSTPTFLFLDRNFDRIPSPMPNAISSGQSEFLAMFYANRENFMKKRCKSLVRRIQSQLERFEKRSY